MPNACERQALAAFHQRFAAYPDLLFEHRDPRVGCLGAGGNPGALQGLAVFLDHVSQTQPCKKEEGLFVGIAGRLVEAFENCLDQFALGTGKQIQCIGSSVFAGQGRPPWLLSWHDSRMGIAHTRKSTARFDRIPLGRPWCEAILLEDGRKLIARPILPGDADTLRRSFGDLTPEEIRFRFLHPITELTPDHARALTHVDRARVFALVLVEALPPEQARIGAVARAIIDEGGKDAEFAIIVGREIGGFGLGAHLLKRIGDWSRKKGMRTLYGDVMVENQRMLRLARRLGFQFRMHPVEPQLVRIWREFRAPDSA